MLQGPLGLVQPQVRGSQCPWALTFSPRRTENVRGTVYTSEEQLPGEPSPHCSQECDLAMGPTSSFPLPQSHSPPHSWPLDHLPKNLPTSKTLSETLLSKTKAVISTFKLKRYQVLKKFERFLRSCRFLASSLRELFWQKPLIYLWNSCVSNYYTHF